MREESGRCGPCGSYLKSILKFLVSHIGLVSLVVGYTIIGAFTFAKLEAEHEVEVKKNMSSVREKVTNELWDITNEMRFLEEFDWSDKARTTLKNFEKSLIKAIKQDGWDGIESDEPKQWTFAGALFYSIILITTIGYGHIAPKTPWGKVVTIFYAIPGVPLMMLCLANIGDGMAHSFRFLYWKVCCYACTKRPKKKKRTKSTSRISRSSHLSSAGSGHPRPQRTSSLRRSARNSQRSADSQYSDSAFYSYSEPDYRLPDDGGDLGDGPGRHHSNRGGPPPPATHREDAAIGPSRGSSGKGGRASDRSNAANRASQVSRGSDEPRDQDNSRVAVLYNKYALDKDGGLDEGEEGDLGLPAAQQHRSSDRSGSGVKDNYGSSSSGRGRARSSDMVGLDTPRGGRNTSPAGTPSLGRSLPRDSSSGRHYLSPDPRMLPPRLEAHHYIEDDDSDDYDDGPGDDDDPGDKPVPIWLGVMLVVAYILGGAVLFAGWEGWDFLDSVYFCFITLTTIGFGDFVPAQEKKANAELSIALCSLYLLFGIALLAMSFNLVQEEVISNVKSVAKRLGIIKEEGREPIQD